MKRLKDIPDWMGTALIGICTSLIGFAVMWGSLKSEVSAQVTAQSTDASDIKQLISGQAGLAASVNAIAQDQKQQYKLLLSLVNRDSGLRDNSSTFGSTRAR